MFTPGFKFFFGFALFAFLGAWVYGFASGGEQPFLNHVLGPLTFGWKGGVGEHYGYTVLMTAAAASGFIGLLLIAFRDAGPTAQAGALAIESAPLTQAPADASYWPVFAAFGLGVLMVGFVVDRSLVLTGAILLAIAAIEWTAKAWSERATGDPVANRELRNRIMHPFEIPLGGFAFVAIVFVGISRVLLAVSKTNSVIIGGIVAVLIFAACVAVAVRPPLRRNVLAIIVVLFAIGIIGAGIASAVVGEREFEQHGGGESHSGEDEGTMPLSPVVTIEGDAS